MSLLQRIQTLQFTDKVEAERLLLGFIDSVFPLDVVACELRPQAISLNSFNGFITLASGERKFFKTHTEEDNVIDEYYNASLLAETGYPVIQPIHSSTQAGQHLLIYEVIESPSVFDLVWAIEQGDDTTSLDALTRAQNAADDDLLAIYKRTLEMQTAQDAAQAPIHQLFHHRLVRGRLHRFYGPLPGEDGECPNIYLPVGAMDLKQVRQRRWSINGQIYDETLNDIISHAVHILAPEVDTPSIIGHGDAHNGNVFFQQDGLLYFDPAFAGRHHPLLDLVKPLFHNVFAMWMYYPVVKQKQLTIHMTYDDNMIMVKHDYDLPPLRHMFLRSKVERTLIPIARILQEKNLLRDDWRTYIKAALFCCPFLTLNLADNKRFSPEISLLGLTMAVEMGGDSQTKRSLIDTVLDEVEQAL